MALARTYRRSFLLLLYFRTVDYRPPEIRLAISISYMNPVLREFNTEWTVRAFGSTIVRGFIVSVSFTGYVVDRFQKMSSGVSLKLG